MTTQAFEILQYFLAQVAAESYFDNGTEGFGNIGFSNEIDDSILNSRYGFGANHYLHYNDLKAAGDLSATQATDLMWDDFKSTWNVIAQQENTRSGFSGTLLYNETTGQYTLAFRSTEAKGENKGGDVDRDSANGANGEISTHGFAWGQIRDMQRFYQDLVNPASSHYDAAFAAHINNHGQLNVSGYSLGAHLAQVFTRLYNEDVLHAYTFNGAGMGTIKGIAKGVPMDNALTTLMETFNTIMDDPASMLERLTDFQVGEIWEGFVNPFPDEHWEDSTLTKTDMFDAIIEAHNTWMANATEDSSIYAFNASPLYKLAVSVVGLETTGVFWQGAKNLLSDVERSQIEFADSKITNFFGHASTGDEEFVAVSGQRFGSGMGIFIEDQANSNSWSLIEQFTNSKSWMDDLTDIAGNTHSISLMIDSLLVADLLQRLDPGLLLEDILGQLLPAAANETAADFLAFDPDDVEANSHEVIINAFGNLFFSDWIDVIQEEKEDEFGSIDYRKQLHNKIFSLREKFTELHKDKTTPTIELLTNKTATDIAELANTDSAYRYALVHLNAFAVRGDSSLYSEAEYGRDQFSDQYIADRAEALQVLLTRNAMNLDGTVPTASETVYYDYATGEEIFSSGGNTAIHSQDDMDACQMHFGTEADESFQGGKNNDRFYGAKGADTYVFNTDTDFGHDIIDDKDGGSIVIDGIELSVCGFSRVSDSCGVFTTEQSKNITLNYDEANHQLKIVVRRDNGTLSGIITIINVGTSGGGGGGGIQNNFDLSLPDFTEPVAPIQAGEPVHSVDSEGNHLPPQLDSHFSNPVRHDASLYYSDAYIDEAFDRATSFLFEGGSGNDVLNGSGWHARQEAMSVDGFTTYTDNKGMMTFGTSFANSTEWIGDLLYGNDGDDVIRGDVGVDPENADNDFLVGGKGNDQLFGDGGNDVLLAADSWQMKFSSSALQSQVWQDEEQIQHVDEALFKGLVEIETEDEHNFLDGGAGNDTLVGASFKDMLIGGEGGDLILASAGQDLAAGGDGDDLIYGDSSGRFSVLETLGVMRYVPDLLAPDLLPSAPDHRAWFFKTIHDEIQIRYSSMLSNNAFNDVLDGGAGNDVIFGEIGNDVILGAAGDDYLHGDRSFHNAAAIRQFGDFFQGLSAVYHGDDVMDGGEGNDRIVGGGGNDVLSGDNGDDVILGDLGFGIEDDALASNEAWWGNDKLYGGKGRDILLGEGGDDELSGDDDHDELYGGVGNDSLFGGKGNDILNGEAGDDSYIVRAGDGQDTLEDIEGANTLTLIGTWLKDRRLQVEQVGDTVRLLTSADGNHFISMHITTWENLQGHIEYSDGSLLDAHDTEINADPDQDTPYAEIKPNAGDSYILHNDANNYAALSLMNDIVHEGVAVTVDLHATDGSALITIPGATEAEDVTIHVDDWENFYGLMYNSGTENTGFTIKKSSESVGGIVLLGKSGNDTYMLPSAPLTSNMLTSAPLSEPVVDTLFDEAGRNTLQLAGTAVRVSLRIDQNDAVGAEQDVNLRFGIRVFNNGTDSGLQMDRNSWETISLKDAAGQIFDLPVSVLGADGFSYEVSADTATGIKILQLAEGLSLENCQALRSGNDLLLSPTDTRVVTAVLVRGFFGEQTAGWSWRISDGVNSEPLDTGGEGWLANHLLNSGDAFVPMDMDLFRFFQRFDMESIGQRGDSLLAGWSSFQAGESYYGNGDTGKIDKYNFLGVTLEGPLRASELEPGAVGYADEVTGIRTITSSKKVKRWINHYKSVSLPGGFSNTVKSGGHWETVTVEDTFLDIHRTIKLQEIVGDDADDVVTGEYFRGTIDLGDGNNQVDLSLNYPGTSHRWPPMPGLGAFIQSGSGDDMLIGTGANDVISAGDGHNLVDGGAGNDAYLVSLAVDSVTCIHDSSEFFERESNTVMFAEGIDASQLTWTEMPIGNNLKAIQLQQISGSGTLVVMMGRVLVGERWVGIGVQTFRFSDGSEYTLEQLSGPDGTENIIYGDWDADTVVHHVGDGDATLIMQRGGGYEEDTLVLIGSGDASAVTFEQDKTDLLVRLSGEVIRIKDFTWQAAGAVNRIQLFASQADYESGFLAEEWGLDGSANPLLDLNNHWSLQTSDTRDDVITVWDGSGDENFNGQGGDDVLNTRDGDDILAGGTGNDTLIGGSGSDTYVFAAGDGSDTIYNADPDASNSDEDVLEIAGITDYRDLWFSENNDDLVVKVLGTSDQITIKHWFAADNNSGDSNKLDAFRAMDTSNNTFVLESDPFNQLLAAMSSFGTVPPAAGWASSPASQPEENLVALMAATWGHA